MGPDAGLKGVKELKHLTSLWLTGTKSPDGGMKELKELWERGRSTPFSSVMTPNFMSTFVSWEKVS